MPKKHSKADLRNILKVEARRLGLSVAHLNKRLKSDGDNEVPVLPPENIVVSRDTCNPSSNAFTTDRRLCTVEEHSAQAGAVTTVEECFGQAGVVHEAAVSHFAQSRGRTMRKEHAAFR
jgi:hypothetical protein